MKKLLLFSLPILLLASCSKDNPLNPTTVITTYTVYGPYDAVEDKSGNLFITNSNDYNIIKVNTAGTISTYAGTNNKQGYSGDGGQATAAKLGLVSGITMDKYGNLYFCNDNCIRKVDTSKIINTIAGTSNKGYSGDGGMATTANLYSPLGVAVDTAANLYIGDYSNCRVRKVNTKTGIITTIAGNGTPGYMGDGGMATAAELNGPDGIAVDDSGNVYIGDYQNFVVRKIYASTGMIVTLAGNGTKSYTTDGLQATSTGLFPGGSIALDTARNLYITDSYNNRVLKLNAKTNIITTVAGNGIKNNKGDGGPATAASLSIPTGVFVDKAGDVFIVDNGSSSVREVDATTHIITTVVHN